MLSIIIFIEEGTPDEFVFWYHSVSWGYVSKYIQPFFPFVKWVFFISFVIE